MALKKVGRWAKTEGVSLNPQSSATEPTIYKAPKGVTLTIGPFDVSSDPSLYRGPVLMWMGGSVPH